MANLKEKCEKAKCNLSTGLETNVTYSSLFSDRDNKITRARFEFLCDGRIYEKLADPIEEALEEADLDADEIDQIILVGGSSHIPFVKEAVKSFFDDRIEPLSIICVDEAIAIGACIICEQLRQGKTINDLKGKIEFHDINKRQTNVSDDVVSDVDDGYIFLVDTMPVSIGIRNGGKGFYKFFSHNSELPQESTIEFTTTKKNQRNARIEVFLGESKEIKESAKTHMLIDTIRLTNLPSKERGEVLINITMSIDENYNLKVTATCNGSSEGTSSIEKNVREFLKPEPMKEFIEKLQKQRESAEKSRLLQQYNALLNKLYEIISIIKREGKNTGQWEAVYANFSENKPKTPDSLQQCVSRLYATVNKISELTTTKLNLDVPIIADEDEDFHDETDYDDIDSEYIILSDNYPENADCFMYSHAF